MNTAFYTASAGVKYMQKNMDVIANNMANVQTAGFKPSVSNFGDLLYSNIHRGGDDTTNLKVGHGVKINKNSIIMNQGGLEPTQRELDFALVGDGFFAVENENGERFYTRAGNFYLKLDGENANLVTATGEYVLGPDGDRIEITKPEGSNTYDFENFNTRIGVFSFPNKYGLWQEGSNLYTQTEVSGEPDTATGYDLMQGYLESSKTDMSKEMVDVIVTQRAFQFNARMVQVADELDAMVNNLR